MEQGCMEQKCDCDSEMQSVPKRNVEKELQTPPNAVHRSQNSEDLTPFGQSKITDIFQSKSRIPKEAEEVLVDKSIESDDNESESRENRDYDRKRRRESVDSGVGKDLRCPVSKKVREVLDDSEKVPNNDLNEKLDKILKSVEELNQKFQVKDNGDVERLNSLPPAENPVMTENSAQTALLKKIRYSRSMAEILDSGFSYDKETEKLSCSVCEDMSSRQLSEEFVCSFENGLEFGDDDLIPREFSNLKKTVCHHISGSKSHADALKDRDEKEKDAKELKSKNRQAGLNLGQLCMKNYLLGRPYTDYESDVLVFKKSGAVVGSSTTAGSSRLLSGTVFVRSSTKE